MLNSTNILMMLHISLSPRLTFYPFNAFRLLPRFVNLERGAKLSFFIRFWRRSLITAALCCPSHFHMVAKNGVFIFMMFDAIRVCAAVVVNWLLLTQQHHEKISNAFLLICEICWERTFDEVSMFPSIAEKFLSEKQFNCRFSRSHFFPSITFSRLSQGLERALKGNVNPDRAMNITASSHTQLQARAKHWWNCCLRSLTMKQQYAHQHSRHPSNSRGGNSFSERNQFQLNCRSSCVYRVFRVRFFSIKSISLKVYFFELMGI